MMQKIELVGSAAIGGRVWRDLGQLAAEAAVIGILFSLLLSVGVFVMARDGRGDALAPANTSPATTAVHPTT